MAWIWTLPPYHLSFNEHLTLFGTKIGKFFWCNAGQVDLQIVRNIGTWWKMSTKVYRPRPIIKLNALQQTNHNTASSFHSIQRKYIHIYNTWKSLSFFESFRPCTRFFFQMVVLISSIAKSLYINTCVDLRGFRYLDCQDCANPQQTRVLSGFVMPFVTPIIKTKHSNIKK